MVWVGWLGKSDIELTSAKVEVEVEAELGKNVLQSQINPHYHGGGGQESHGLF